MFKCVICEHEFHFPSYMPEEVRQDSKFFGCDPKSHVMMKTGAMIPVCPNCGEKQS